MQFEHFGINVPDPVAMADWYVTYLRMQVLRQVDGGANARWIADATGRCTVEIYHNDAAPLPVYAELDPLVFHVAFAVPDAAATRDALVAAGAKLVSDDRLEDGSHLVMLRDPWGVPLQLCQRADPLTPPVS